MSDQPSSKKPKTFKIDNDHLAEVRTSMARSRTYLAAERTYAAWVRTGFAIAGAGVAMGTALKNTQSRWLSWGIGTSLIFVGVFSFIYAWRGYKSIHNYLTAHYPKKDLDIQSFSFNYFAISLITIILLASSILGFYLMFY